MHDCPSIQISSLLGDYCNSTSSLLFPQGRDFVIRRREDLEGVASSRPAEVQLQLAWVQFYKFLFPAAAWSRACLWYHPIKSDDAGPYLPGIDMVRDFCRQAEESKRVCLEEVNFHNYMGFSDLDQHVPGAHNRYYFSIPHFQERLLGSRNDQQYLWQSRRVYNLLSDTTWALKEKNLTVCELIDIGRVHREITSAMAGIYEKKLLLEGLELYLYGENEEEEEIDFVTDIVMKKIKSSFSGDLDDCETCSDLPWAHAGVRSLTVLKTSLTRRFRI